MAQVPGLWTLFRLRGVRLFWAVASAPVRELKLWDPLARQAELQLPESELLAEQSELEPRTEQRASR